MYREINRLNAQKVEQGIVCVRMAVRIIESINGYPDFFPDMLVFTQ
jgi:hypothetical protein